MIVYLKGNLTEKEPNQAVLDVSGVGYGVGISLQTYEQLPGKGTDVMLHVYHYITESSQALFGFYTKKEQKLFELLITVKGVGPKLGLTILSGLPAEQLQSAIMSGDTLKLSKIPGIGKKSAERLVLELKDKIGFGDTVSGSSTGFSGGGVADDLRSEAVGALISLGYKQNAAEKAVLKVFGELSDAQKNVSDVIKAALKVLM